MPTDILKMEEFGDNNISQTKLSGQLKYHPNYYKVLRK